jgi:hypothetical protein
MASARINSRKNKALAALISEPTIKGAAEVSGVSERTIYQYLSDAEFKQALTDAESELLSNAQRILIKGQEVALGVLMDVMENSTDNNRRLAAVSWLELTLRLRELVSIEERIKKLEERLR